MTTFSRRKLGAMASALGAGALAPATSIGCRSSESSPSMSTSSSPSGNALGRRAREVTQIVDAQPTMEGAGVKIHRSLGTRLLPLLDPFLMLDEFHTENRDDYIAGFPNHPHRGFETVTYMIDGAMEHRDSLGNHGHLGPGSAQWMTAGHGIVHSEMPQQENGLMWGFQLWVNLPAAKKLVKPRYQDIAPDRIVLSHVDDAEVRVVAGEIAGNVGPVEGIVTAPTMLDVKVGAGGRFRHALPPGHNAFLYIIEGSAGIGSQRGQRVNVNRGQLAVLGPGDHVDLQGDATSGARGLLLAGAPIGEPVARYGPFVMNTDAELRTAMDDYRSGRLIQM